MDDPVDPPVEDSSYDRKVRRQLVRTGRAIVKGAKQTPSLVATQMQTWVEQSVEQTIERELDNWRAYVAKLREQRPELGPDEIAQLIIKRRALKNGVLGAVTSVGGVLALPVMIPADVVGSFHIQIRTALALACVYGHDKNVDNLKTDIFLVLAGEGASHVLKKAGIGIGQHVTKKAVEKYITREVMKKIWKVVPQKLLTKAGQKSATSFMRLVPLVGAPIGFGVDYAAARTTGAVAARYYSGRA